MEEKQQQQHKRTPREGVPHKLKAYRIPLEGEAETTAAIKALLKQKRRDILKQRKAKKL